MIIEEAKQKYKIQTPSEHEESILYKLLKKDEKYASVMAFDMIFGGIDTVRKYFQFSIQAQSLILM